MTKFLKELLHNYGLLYITIAQLAQQRPGCEKSSLVEYDEKLGEIETDEPVVVVRVSNKGESRLLKEGEHDFALLNSTGEQVGQVTVMELPEDEYYFFRAFRVGLFELSKELPSFIFAMSIIHAYTLFENYLSHIVRLCYREHPELMGSNKKLDYGQIFESRTKDEILGKIIEKELRDLFHLPIAGILEVMRERLGFKKLTAQFDGELSRISLIRNCLVHNGGKVDDKLSSEYGEMYRLEEQLNITKQSVDEVSYVLRKFCYEVDEIVEAKRLTNESSRPS